MNTLFNDGTTFALGGIIVILVLREVFSFLKNNGNKKNGTVTEHIKKATDENNQRLREMAIHNQSTTKTMDRIAASSEEQLKVMTRLVALFDPTSSLESDCNVAVSLTFGDGTIATITFSTKGHMFEGIREHFTIHKGNAFIFMKDFQTLTIDIIEKRFKTSRWFRDQGHEAKVCRSYSMVRPQGSDFEDTPLSYIWETGDLFLKTKEALEQQKKITLQPYSEDILRRQSSSNS